MRPSLQQRCDRLVANEAIIKKVGVLNSDKLIKLGGLLYLNAGRTPDVARIKECRKILKKKAGILSNFRGELQFVVLLKMALADDPVAYIDDALYVHKGLTKGKLFSGEMLAMTAMVIVDQCEPSRYDEVIAKTRDAYSLARKAHPFLTNEYDMALIALMCINHVSTDVMADRAEELFQALRDRHVPRNASQASSMVLALSDKPANVKADELVGLYAELKAAKHAAPRDACMAIYAAYADVDLPLDQLVDDISEVDVWLKHQKGYGILGAGSDIRRVIAAAVVLGDYEENVASSAAAGSASAIAESIAEQIVLIITMLIIISLTMSATSSSN